MTTEKQLANLELRLRMAVEHVAQCEQDLNAIRAKAGLGPVKSLFNLEKPAGDGGWMSDPGRAEWLARQAAKAPGASAAAEPRISQEMWAVLAERGRRERGELDPPPASEKATAEAILRAAAIAKGELTELPPVGSPARSILESAAKRRSETLDGKPL